VGSEFNLSHLLSPRSPNTNNTHGTIKICCNVLQQSTLICHSVSIHADLSVFIMARITRCLLIVQFHDQDVHFALFRVCFSLLNIEAWHNQHILMLAAAVAIAAPLRHNVLHCAHHGTPVLAMHSISRYVREPRSSCGVQKLY
jgi:hypothetical protein